MEDRIKVTMSDGVADVRLVRADKMNALDFAMFEALVATCDRLSPEKGLRAVVLSGEGRAFCAGLDMGRFATMKESGGKGSPAAEARPVRTHARPRQLSAICGVGLARTAGAGDRRDPWRGARRRLPARARRRHALRRRRTRRMSILEIKWGLVPDMAGTPILAQPGARRYSARPHLYRPHLLGAGSHELWPRDADLRRSATRRRWRPRAKSPARARMRSAPPSAC